MRLNTHKQLLLGVLLFFISGASWLVWPRETWKLPQGEAREILFIRALPFLWLAMISLLDPTTAMKIPSIWTGKGRSLRPTSYLDKNPPSKKALFVTRVFGFLLLLFFVTTVF